MAGFSAAARKVARGQEWGVVNQQTTFAKGAAWFSCSGHGGCVVDCDRFDAATVALFDAAGMTRTMDGLKVVVGEEDCGYATVFFADDSLRVALNEKGWSTQTADEVADTVKNWDPDFYAAVTGRALTGADSSTMRKREFVADNASNYVTRAAWGDWHEKVPAGMVGVVATRKTDGDEGYFLVRSGEYGAANGTFVVDTRKHARVEGW